MASFLDARKYVVHEVLQRGRLPSGWGCSRGDGGSGLLRFCCAVGALEPELKLQDVRLGAAAGMAQTFTRIHLSLVLVVDSFDFRRLWR